MFLLLTIIFDRYIVDDSVVLNSTAVSGVITLASSAQVSGHAPQITIPKYPWALPVGDIHPGYRLGLIRDQAKSATIRSQFGFKYKSSDCSSARHE